MNLLLVLISALSYVASFPWWDASFFAFFALVPLFAVVENVRSIQRAIGYGALWGVLIAGGMGYWLFPTLIDHFDVWPPTAVLFFLFAVAAPSCLIYTVLIAAYRFSHHRHLAWYALVVPSIWTLAEYVKEMIPVFLPWGSIGYAALPFHRFVQIADLGGVHGLTFVMVMINALIWFMLRHVRQRAHTPGWPMTKPLRLIRPVLTASYPATVLLLLAVCLPLVYGTYRLHWIDGKVNDKMTTTAPLRAVLVQGNFNLDDRWSGMGFFHRLQTYLDMSASQRRKKDGQSPKNGKDLPARVIVWPETTLNEPVRLGDSLFRQIMGIIGKEAVLISGGLAQDAAAGQVANCAYFASGEGLLARYDKHILLPYAETSMGSGWLGQYYNAPAEFVPGRTPSCMETPGGRVGMSICMEILYPRYIARSVQSGAAFLVNISNDAWFGDSPMPHMHLNAARMRAIENRRFLLRTANSGISALIAPDGRVIAATDLFRRQVIEGDFVPMGALSPYTRYGDWLLFLSGCAFGLALLRIVLKKN